MEHNDPVTYLGWTPLLCEKCGRPFINMRCKFCDPPYIPDIRPTYGILTTKRQYTPRQRPQNPKPMYFAFDWEGAPALGLILDPGRTINPPIIRGEQKPFGNRCGSDHELKIFSSFEYNGHEWESEVESRNQAHTSNTILYQHISLQFQNFVKAIEQKKCRDWHKCLCAGLNVGPFRWEHIVIRGYTLIDEGAEFRLEVDFNIDPSRTR